MEDTFSQLAGHEMMGFSKNKYLHPSVNIKYTSRRNENENMV